MDSSRGRTPPVDRVAEIRADIASARARTAETLEALRFKADLPARLGDSVGNAALIFTEHVFDRVANTNGNQLVVPLGTFAANEHKTLLVRVRVPRGAAGERAVAAVRLKYDDLAESKPGTCEGHLAARLSTDGGELTPLDGLVSGRVSATETAATLQQANDLFNAGRAAM